MSTGLCPYVCTSLQSEPYWWVSSAPLLDLQEVWVWHIPDGENYPWTILEALNVPGVFGSQLPNPLVETFAYEDGSCGSLSPIPMHDPNTLTGRDQNQRLRELQVNSWTGQPWESHNQLPLFSLQRHTERLQSADTKNQGHWREVFPTKESSPVLKCKNQKKNKNLPSKTLESTWRLNSRWDDSISCGRST